MCHLDLWCLFLFLLVRPGGLSLQYACRAPSTCRSASSCRQQLESNGNTNLIIFPCEHGVCCPPPPSKNNSSPFLKKPTTESPQKLAETDWDDFYSPSPTEEGQIGLQPLSSPILSHRNRRLLPKHCGMILTNKVVAGVDAVVGEFPWMALIGFKGDNGVVGYVCGGTLISDRYVLTAAHCLHRDDSVLSTVRLGEHDLNKESDCNGKECFKPAVDFSVEKIIGHEGYNNSSYKNDIALLRLNASALDLGYITIAPICLPLNESTPNATAVVTYEVAGWGLTGWREDYLSPILQKTDLPSFSDRACNSVVCAEGRETQAFCPIDRTQMCVQGSRKRDVCKGDSGGPLMTKDRPETTQIGITSFKTTEVCGEENVPSVFTRVQNYVPWILDHLES